MTKKQASNFLFGLFTIITVVIAVIWAANTSGIGAFFIGAGWVVMINIVQYLIEKRVNS